MHSKDAGITDTIPFSNGRLYSQYFLPELLGKGGFIVKEYEYNPELPHGMLLDAYTIARPYGIASAWTEYKQEFDSNSIVPSGLLNQNGLDLHIWPECF